MLRLRPERIRNPKLRENCRVKIDNPDETVLGSDLSVVGIFVDQKIKSAQTEVDFTLDYLIMKKYEEIY